MSFVVCPTRYVSRPFHTACLAAVILRDEQKGQKRPQTAVQSVFSKDVEEFIASIFESKLLTARNDGGQSEDESMKMFVGYAPTGARRLMGMDEDYAGFIHFLDSEPKLTVGDFGEAKLGLLRLSINLNPTMVAKVTSWTRSKYD